jgi:hypothetical protein
MRHWNELSDETYDTVWDRFNETLKFNPSVNATDWPGIEEPNPSCTYSIASFYDRGKYDELAAELTVTLFGALRDSVPHDSEIYALNWQHESYLARLDQIGDLNDSDEWPVPVFPNGDYYNRLSIRIFRASWGKDHMRLWKSFC